MLLKGKNILGNLINFLKEKKKRKGGQNQFIVEDKKRKWK